MLRGKTLSQTNAQPKNARSRRENSAATARCVVRIATVPLEGLLKTDPLRVQSGVAFGSFERALPRATRGGVICRSVRGVCLSERKAWLKWLLDAGLSTCVHSTHSCDCTSSPVTLAGTLASLNRHRIASHRIFVVVICGADVERNVDLFAGSCAARLSKRFVVLMVAVFYACIFY